MSAPIIHNDLSLHIDDAPVTVNAVVFNTFTTLELVVGTTTVRLYVKDLGDVVKVASAIMSAAVSPRHANHI